MSERSRPTLRANYTPDTLVNLDEDGPLLLSMVDLALPCRRFAVDHKVAEVGRISVTAEFLLRLIKAVGSCSEEAAQEFFGYNRREMAYVLAEVEEADYVDRTDGRLTLTSNGLGLFHVGSDDPVIYEVERKTARIGLDLLSLAPAETRSTSVFERCLPELPLVDPKAVSSATGRVPSQFRRHFRELAPRMDSVAAARRSLYSIDGVTAEERFSSVVRVKLVSTGSKPAQPEVDLSDWRLEHEISDREAVGRAVLQIVERLKATCREDDADAYNLLTELAPEYLKEWMSRGALNVKRFYRHAFASKGQLASNRQTTPIIGSLFTPENARRLMDVATHGLKGSKNPSPALFWVIPQIPLWGSTSILAEVVDQLRDLVLRHGRGLPSAETVALTSGPAESWIRQAFNLGREAPAAAFPGGFEMLLSPGSFIAATVHAPVGIATGYPVPLGFASFDPVVVDRASSLLRHAATSYGLGEELRYELEPHEVQGDPA